MSCAKRIHVADWGQMMMAQERPNPLAQTAIRFTRSRNMLIITSIGCQTGENVKVSEVKERLTDVEALPEIDPANRLISDDFGAATGFDDLPIMQNIGLIDN